MKSEEGEREPTLRELVVRAGLEKTFESDPAALEKAFRAARAHAEALTESLEMYDEPAHVYGLPGEASRS